MGKYEQVNISRTIHLFLNLETRANIRFYMKQQHVKMHCILINSIPSFMDIPGGSVVKNLPAKQKMWVQFLHKEESLKKEISALSSTLAWELHGQRTIWGHKRVAHNLVSKQQQFHIKK